MNKANIKILEEMEKRATPKDQAQTMREDSHRDEEQPNYVYEEMLPQCEDCRHLTANGKYKTITEDDNSVDTFLCPSCYKKI